jgi:hypothetical protein
MDLEFEITARDGSQLLPIDIDYTVESYSNSAIGGPSQAVITARGSERDLWELIERLRCHVKIKERRGGQSRWWGYVSEVNSSHYSISIEDMFNRIAIAYMQLDGTTEERETTAWADDLTSQAVYGIKEMLWSASSSTQIHAETARDTKLAQVKYPVPSRPMTGEKLTEAQIICRGWWDTLGWLYYINPDTDDVDTATQIVDIITAKGPFFRAIANEVTSGIDVTEARDGDATALYEVVQLLELGTTNYRRMLAAVDEYRTVRIFEEPALSTQLYRLRPDGALYNPYGTQERKTLCPAGVWMRLEDAVPPTVDMTYIGDPSLIFVEEMEYDAVEDRLTPTPRGHLDPWMFPVVRDG